ncbi:MAG TPA: 3-mercaptopyruvate sulfurtransferase [Devosia sp.]|nr:3-mercaptopyruvate sulfurtransferase [Devosia sp.]
MMGAQSPFVSTDWLRENLSAPEVRVVDATWYLPNDARDARAEYAQRHIPGAVYFDLDRIADTTSDLPHMVAPPDVFSDKVGELGIRDTNTIVIYDAPGLFSAARVWWNFRIMGAQNCFVLKGGLNRWMAEGHPVTDQRATPARVPFTARFADTKVISEAQIQALLKTPDIREKFQFVDLRPAMRFAGLEEEPRPGVRSGYMPGSINLPYSDLIEGDQLCEPEQLAERIRAAGIDPEKPLIASCGSGVTAPILCLALAELGINAMHVYDGSWAEWAAQNDNPVLGADGNPAPAASGATER